MDMAFYRTFIGLCPDGIKQVACCGKWYAFRPRTLSTDSNSSHSLNHIYQIQTNSTCVWTSLDLPGDMTLPWA